MAISKEQWDGLADTFTFNSFAKAVFKYQNHKIEVFKRARSPEKNVFVVFIDGEINGEWWSPTHCNFNPLVKLFWNHNNSKIYKKAEIEKAKKIYGKKEYEKSQAKYYDKRHDFYSSDFSSLKKLITQFKKIEGLELVKGDCL